MSEGAPIPSSTLPSTTSSHSDSVGNSESIAIYSIQCTLTNLNNLGPAPIQISKSFRLVHEYILNGHCCLEYLEIYSLLNCEGEGIWINTSLVVAFFMLHL